MRYLPAIACSPSMLIVRFTATAQAFTTVDERSPRSPPRPSRRSRLYRIADLSTRIALTDGDTTSRLAAAGQAANLRATQRGLDEGDPALALPAVAPTEELTALLDGDARLNAQVYGIADDATPWRRWPSGSDQETNSSPDRPRRSWAPGDRPAGERRHRSTTASSTTPSTSSARRRPSRWSSLVSHRRERRVPTDGPPNQQRDGVARGGRAPAP
ncbi:MAG: hypothetical protein R2699_02470 [Acidimicrobiales bacterium]